MTDTETSSPNHTYIRLWELHDIASLTSDDGLDYFEFMPSKAKLILRRGDWSTDSLPTRDEIEEALGEGELYVSGQEGYRKHFSSRVVSHDHCEIRWKPTQRHPRLTDLGSTHGTFLMRLGSNVPWCDLHGEMKKAAVVEVKESIPLQDGDIIQLGKPVVRAKEHHQPAYLLVQMCQSGDVIAKQEAGPDVALPVEKSNASLKINSVDEKEDEVNVISSDEEQITLVRGRSGYEPLNLDISDSGSTCNSESFDLIAEKDLDKVSKSKGGQFILQDLVDSGLESANEDEEEEEIGESVMSESAELEGESDIESSVASDEDEEKSNKEASASEDDLEEVQDKQAIVLPSSSFHHDYEALIRADESYRENQMKQATEAAEKGAEELLIATMEAAEDQIVEGNSTSEVSETVQVDADSSQEETLASVDCSSPIIDKDSDCSTDATSEAEEVIEVKETGIQEKTRVFTASPSANLQQAAGKKRSREELEEGEVADGADLTAPAPSSTSPPIALPVSQSPSFKKLKTFTAGLAAGILAGAVGTFVGLNSLVLDDSSFL